MKVNEMQKTIGIIGGMGPLATVDLMSKIISFTDAKEDQDHIHVIADNYPQIPDRTAAITGYGDDPTSCMVESAQRLEQAGAHILIMACNTAHYFFNAVNDSVQIPVVHMPRETIRFVKKEQLSNVGLLATDGTIITNVYQQYCQKHRINMITPDARLQRKVMDGIYAIKAGLIDEGHLFIENVAKSLESRGAEAIIAGCTEVPIVLSQVSEFRVIDPTEIAAKQLIKLAKQHSEYSLLM